LERNRVDIEETGTFLDRGFKPGSQRPVGEVSAKASQKEPPLQAVHAFKALSPVFSPKVPFGQAVGSP
jgi:hypothetical protein